jgi:hypothetical protein
MAAKVDLGLIPSAQQESWEALLTVAKAVPSGWCLVGGQMVYLLATERGAPPLRTTDDVDAVLDVRADPRVLSRFTRALLDAEFKPQSDMSGHHSWWTRGQARIDIMIPTSLGRAARTKGASGGTALETPAAQQALDRSERVAVKVDSSEGHVWRPNMLGALVAKAAASGVALDRGTERHLTDFAVLSTLVRPGDAIADTIFPRDIKYLKNALGRLANRQDLVSQVNGAGASLDLLKRIVERAAKA